MLSAHTHTQTSSHHMVRSPVSLNRLIVCLFVCYVCSVSTLSRFLSITLYLSSDSANMKVRKCICMLHDISHTANPLYAAGFWQHMLCDGDDATIILSNRMAHTSTAQHLHTCCSMTPFIRHIRCIEYKGVILYMPVVFISQMMRSLGKIRLHLS